MELKSLKPSVQVRAEMEKGGELVFTVQHVNDAQFELDYIGKWRKSETIIAVLSDAILAWNIDHDNGTPWECTPETRPLIITEIAGRKVLHLFGADGKEIGEVAGFPLGLALFTFVRNDRNYLKN